MKDVLRLGIAVVVATLVGAAAGAAPTTHALLVGCTKYANPAIPSLEGPANDVVVLKNMLKQYYHLQDKDAVILSEVAGEERGVRYRPTRANIEREFAELANKATKGDKVVILLAGHGAQQPDSRSDDPLRFEPDGKEEIFLPADCGLFDGVSAVKNAIVDYEFLDWLTKIRTTGASLWVIVDACHSGSMIRGTDVPRKVPEGKLVPTEALRKAEDKARTRQAGRGSDAKKKIPTFKVPPEEPDLVAIYAAQSFEVEVELLLPQEGSNRKAQGLLTYTLCKVLVQAHEANSPLTYQELLQRIHQEYRAMEGRSSPTPQIEGKDRDRVVLGEKVRGAKAARLRFPLDRDESNNWIVQAGDLHGMMVGSILQVFPAAGQPNADKPVGHVRIMPEGFGPLQARVEPCEYAGMPPPKQLPRDGRCELVLVYFGDQRLTVGVDERTNKGQLVPEERRRPLREVLAKLAEGEESLIKVARSPAEAQWLLRFDSLASDKLFLVPASGWLLPGDTAKTSQGGSLDQLPPLFGPIPDGDRRLTWLRESLTNIARVRNLRCIVNQTQFSPPGAKGEALAMSVRLELVVRGKPIKRGPQDISLYDKDVIGIRIINDGRNPVDVNLLLLNSQYGIKALFPKKSTIDNRLLPGKSLPLLIKASADTSGLENFLLIAVDAKDLGEYAYFGFLEQRSIEIASRGAGARERGFDSPFGRLLRQAVYGEGRTKQRGADTTVLGEYAFDMLPYKLVPTKRPAEKK